MSDLVLIYNFQNAPDADAFMGARYQVVYFFSEAGFVEHALLQEMAKTVPEANHQGLSFMNLDDLKAFALRVQEEVDGKNLRIVSVQDYNVGIDGARDMDSFKGIFSKFGEQLGAPVAAKKKGLLGKLFS